MSAQHRGNMLNEVTFEEHSGADNAKRVVVVGGSISAAGQATVTLYSTPTLFAVVNTAAAGQASVVVDRGHQFIGLVTVGNTVSTTFAGNVTLDPGSKTGIVGNVTLSDAKTFIGLTTAVNGQAWPDPKTYIGLVTIGHTANVAVVGNVTISDSKGFIGLVTLGGGPVIAAGDVASGAADSGNPVKIGGKVNTTLPTYSDGQRGEAQISTRGALRVELGTGSSTVNFGGRADNADAVAVSSTAGNFAVINRNTVYNGTSWDRQLGDTGGTYVKNAGTTKTLEIRSVGFSVASITTIAVPTNAQRIKVTMLTLNADATVNIRIKSGVTYLTGNASIGVTLNPGGGYVKNGSPDSPAWIGLPSGALVVEKFDMTGTSAKIAGDVMYFDET